MRSPRGERVPVAHKLRTDRVGRRDRAAIEKALSALSAKLQTVSMCDDGVNVLDNDAALINIVTFDTVCHTASLISFQSETFLPLCVRLF